MNVISIGIFGIIFISILGLLSNSSTTGTKKIEDEMFLMNCPSPIYSGTAVAGSPSAFIGFSVNYTISYNSSDHGLGSSFQCKIDNITGNEGFSIVSTRYNATAFSVVPTGWFRFVADTVTTSLNYVYHLFVIIALFVTPMNFNILGITFAELTGIGLALVVLIYALCYIAVGAMIYKVVSPFAGGG